MNHVHTLFNHLLKRHQQVECGPMVYVIKDVARETGQLISSFGSTLESHEGIAYWAGIPSDKVWIITTVFAPKAKTAWGSYKTSTVANAHVIAKVNELKLQLLAQVHGHPGSWVGHSETDDHGAFMPYEGFYSVVIPNYGQDGMLPLDRCGIHQYHDGTFHQLTSESVRDRFVILPTSVDLR